MKWKLERKLSEASEEFGFDKRRWNTFLSPSRTFSKSEVELYKDAARAMAEHGTDLLAHAARTAFVAVLLGESMSVDAQTCFIGGLIHDIGKLFVNKEILLKPSRLTPSEYEAIKLHPTLGAEYLSRVGVTSEEILHAVRFHHQTFDNNGYPDEPFVRAELTDIITVADAYDAMTHNRVYATAKARTQALHELFSHQWTQFNPSVVEHFLALAG